jgi:hypothetical protein
VCGCVLNLGNSVGEANLVFQCMAREPAKESLFCCSNNQGSTTVSVRAQKKMLKILHRFPLGWVGRHRVKQVGLPGRTP